VSILSHPDFVAGRHSTRWVEDRLDLSAIAPAASAGADPVGEGTDNGPRVLREVTAEVDGRRYEVRLWVPEVSGSGAARGTRPHKPRAALAGSGSGTVVVPMQGTIVKVLVAPGDTVEIGQTVCVLEAMKMENAITAEKAGTVAEVKVAAGDSVGPGDVIAVIE
jgi:acetyl-CoA/propionyl-CoA carboxylase biotin carboxyl carrier protein